MKKPVLMAGFAALVLMVPAGPAAADEGGLDEGRACKPRVSVTLISDTSVRVDVSSPGFFGSDNDEAPQPEPTPSLAESPESSPTPSPSSEPTPSPTAEESLAPTPEPSEEAAVGISERTSPMVTICPRVTVDVEVVNTTTGQVVDEFSKWRPWLVFKGGWTTTVPVGAGQTIQASATYSGSTVTKRITAPGPPSSPQNVIDTDVKPNAVTLAWTPPRSDGGKPITGYEVSWSGQTRSVTGTSVTIPDLLPRTTYTFAVSAINALGASLSVPLVVTTPAEPTVPSAPRNLTFLTLSSPTQLGLDWVAPADDGGLPIEGYLVTWQGDGITGEMFVTDTSAVVSKLKRGTRFTFEVKARNGVGFSPAVTGRKVTILDPAPRPDVPSAVRNVRVTDTAHTEVTVAWDSPTSDGGSPITSYLVDWATGSQIVTETSATIKGLAPATRVTVNVSAINAFGSSPVSQVTATTLIKPIPRPSVPTVPQNLSTESLNDFILVSFDAPQSDGGAAILYYEAIDEQGGMVQIDVIPSRSLFVLMGPYGPGEIHDIEIRAVNSMGAGPAAVIQGKTSLVPVPAPTVPGVPENLEVVNVENDSVSLVWDAPEDNGGTRIIGYDVSWGTGESLAVPVPSVVIEGLEPGRFYTVEIRAVNQIGAGAPASIDVLTNMTPVPMPERPSVPRDVKVQGVTGSSIAIDWNPPASDGGTPITGYEVVIAGGVGQVVRGTAVLLQGLRPNRVYTVNITAINQIGDSDPVVITAQTAAVQPGPSPAPTPKPFSPNTTGSNTDGSLDVDKNPRSVRQTAPGEWPVNPIARSGKAKPVEKEALFLTNADQMAQLDVTYRSPSIQRVVVAIDPATDTYVMTAQLKKGKVSGAVVLTVEAPSIKRGGITYEPLQSSERFVVRR